jgi:hypothetical protein
MNLGSAQSEPHHLGKAGGVFPFISRSCSDPNIQHDQYFNTLIIKANLLSNILTKAESQNRSKLMQLHNTD